MNIDTLQQKKILVLGSGSGLLVAYLRKEKAFAFGIEISKDACIASSDILKTNNIVSGITNSVGEKIPFKNCVFDLVVSFQVIEHVKNPFQVFKETKRVLKKRGKIYFVIPNYNSFWEGHYGVLWCPFFNKFSAKLYIKLLGKNPDFINTLNFIKPKNIKKWCSILDLKIIDMGKKNFKKNLSSKYIKEYWTSHKILKLIIKFIRTIKLDKVVAFVFNKLNFQYPIILTAYKK